LEILVRAAWKGVHLIPVPISVFYPPKGERISHFRPYRDFLRISVLNTFLVLAAFLFYRPFNFIRNFSWKSFWTYIEQKVMKPDESNGKKATAIGFGIFMGIFPVWGYQMILAVVFAHLFKLNKAIVLIASNISIGPMIPVVVYLSYLFGSIFVTNAENLIFNPDDISLDTMGDFLLQYLVGSILLSLGAGLTIGLISYLTLSIFRKK
jgi:uncharacterized protein (DUF2062 family)